MTFPLSKLKLPPTFIRNKMKDTITIHMRFNKRLTSDYK